MVEYNSPNDARIASMLQTVQHINDNLMDSIEKILERQEKIELLVTRSQMLSMSSSSFRREAVQVRQRIWWQNLRMWLILAGIVLLVILLIVVSSCGITLHHC